MADGGRPVRVAVLGQRAGYFWIEALGAFRLAGHQVAAGQRIVWFPERLLPVGALDWWRARFPDRG